MQAKVTEESGVVVVELIGRMDVEAVGPFRDACLKKLVGKKVVFDFRALSFVGSNGIVSFLEALLAFAESEASGMRLSGAGPEFRKILSATVLEAYGLHETSAEAVRCLANVEAAGRAAAPAPMAVGSALFKDKPEPEAEADSAAAPPDGVFS